MHNTRSLAKPVYDEKFLGESQMSTAEYSNVFEERNQASTTKLPSETELCKRLLFKLKETQKLAYILAHSSVVY